MVTQAQRAQREQARQRYNIIREQVQQTILTANQQLQVPPAAQELKITLERLQRQDERLKQLEGLYNDLLTLYPDDPNEQQQHLGNHMALENNIVDAEARLAALHEARVRAEHPPQQQQAAAPFQPIPIQGQNPVKTVEAYKFPDERKFDGDELKYQGWWDLFNSQVHAVNNVPATIKMRKLLESVKGSALESLEGLSINDDNYQSAVTILQSRFGNPNKIRSAHQRALQMIQPPKDCKGYVSLCVHVNQIEKHLRNLTSAGENVEQSMYVTLVKNKLPLEMVGAIQNRTDGQELTMALLRSEIQRYIRLEDAKDQARKAQTSNTTVPIPSNEVPKTNDETITTLLGTTNSSQPFIKNCVYCDRSNHKPADCRQYSSIPQRVNRLRELNLCFQCFQSNHSIRECRFSNRCSKCGAVKAHHVSLCPSSQGYPFQPRFPSVRGPRGPPRYPRLPAPRSRPVYQQQNPVQQYQSSIPTTVQYSQRPGPFPRYQNPIPRTQNMRPRFPARAATSGVLASYDESNQPMQEQQLYEYPDHVPATLATNNTVVVMKTMLVPMEDTQLTRRVKVRGFGDCGCHGTYITNRAANALNLEPIGPSFTLRVGVFGTGQVQTMTATPVCVVVVFQDGQKQSLLVHSIPVITKSILRHPINVSIPSDIKLADTLPSKLEESPIDLLVGNDYYDDIIGNETLTLSGGFKLKSSKFGWIPTGRLNSPKTHDKDEHLLAMVASQTEESLASEGLEQYWSFETIGIKDKPEADNKEDEIAMKQFEESVEYKEGRVHVGFPFRKERIDQLPDNRDLALRRFAHTASRLEAKESLYEKYVKIMEDQEAKGITEEVKDPYELTEHPVHYISHHEVETPEKDTTKVRIVYNGSAKRYKDALSLNDCIRRGPVMLEDLIGLLIRMRLHSTVLLSDIEKAFLQVGLKMPDRDVTRFFWYKDTEKPFSWNNIRVMRFCRIPFGIIASPFLLAAVINHHLKSVNSPVARQIRSGIYVDNVMLGLNSRDLNKEINIYNESKKLFADIGMNLREWASNHQKFLKAIPEKDRVSHSIIKVLGYKWNMSTDEILAPFCDDLNSEQITKREVVKVVSKLFDPLGLFAPLFTEAKVFMQSLWSSKMKWESKLSEEQRLEWAKIKGRLSGLDKCSVKRNCLLEDPEQKAQNELVVFCDASGKAYSCAVYLKQTIESTVSVSLLFAKTRLTPKEGCTIPRLELMSMLIAKRALVYVESHLSVKILNKKVLLRKTLFSDSQCVLAWVQSGKQLGTFVENRIKEIRQLRNTVFRYVDTKENPADLPTRTEITPDKIHGTNWFNGPTWLKLEYDKWPTFDYPPITEIPMRADEEVAMAVVPKTKKAELTKEDVINISRFNSMSRLEATVAQVYRFVTPKSIVPRGPVSVEERDKARVVLIRLCQKKHYREILQQLGSGKRQQQLIQQLDLNLDADGVIRCFGRLEKNIGLTQATARPILLPPWCPLSKLIVKTCHEENYHAGESQVLATVRSRYWICQGRAVVKSVLRECLICKRYKVKPFKFPAMAPLPVERLVRQIPFQNVGVDPFGPLYVRERGSVVKKWVILFTCLTTRAIHMEVLEDMTTQEFILALRCFISRRGLPKRIVSDNAKQFHLVDQTLQLIWKSVYGQQEVKTFASQKGIQWKFITELSPWKGGVYERMIKIVKEALRKAIGKAILSTRHFSVFLLEVERVVNNRPLTYVSSDLNSSIVITPNSFLNLHGDEDVPVRYDPSETADPDYKETETSAEKLLMMWKKGNKYLDDFWSIWSKDYVLSLRERSVQMIQSKDAVERQPQLGEIVMVEEPGVARNKWRLAKIVELKKSEDGKCWNLVADVNNEEIRTYVENYRSNRKFPKISICPTHLKYDMDKFTQRLYWTARPTSQVLGRSHISAFREGMLYYLSSLEILSSLKAITSQDWPRHNYINKLRHDMWDSFIGNTSYAELEMALTLDFDDVIVERPGYPITNKAKFISVLGACYEFEIDVPMPLILTNAYSIQFALKRNFQKGFFDTRGTGIFFAYNADILNFGEPSFWSKAPVEAIYQSQELIPTTEEESTHFQQGSGRWMLLVRFNYEFDLLLSSITINRVNRRNQPCRNWSEQDRSICMVQCLNDEFCSKMPKPCLVFHPNQTSTQQHKRLCTFFEDTTERYYLSGKTDTCGYQPEILSGKGIVNELCEAQCPPRCVEEIYYVTHSRANRLATYTEKDADFDAVKWANVTIRYQDFNRRLIIHERLSWKGDTFAATFASAMSLWTGFSGVAFAQLTIILFRIATSGLKDVLTRKKALMTILSVLVFFLLLGLAIVLFQTLNALRRNSQDAAPPDVKLSNTTLWAVEAPKAEVPLFTYRGCYSNPNGDLLRGLHDRDSNYSSWPKFIGGKDYSTSLEGVNHCLIFCRDFKFAGVQDGVSCMCGDFIHADVSLDELRQPEDQCNLPCNPIVSPSRCEHVGCPTRCGEAQCCGGQGKIDLYGSMVQEYYTRGRFLGCFYRQDYGIDGRRPRHFWPDTMGQVVQHSSNNNVNTCAEACKGYYFMALNKDRCHCSFTDEILHSGDDTITWRCNLECPNSAPVSECAAFGCERNKRSDHKQSCGGAVWKMPHMLQYSSIYILHACSAVVENAVTRRISAWVNETSNPVQCQDGYSLVGSSTLHCNASKVWHETIMPICV